MKNHVLSAISFEKRFLAVKYFQESSIIDVWQGSTYISDLRQMFSFN